MKKLLQILSTTSLTLTPTSVIACGSKPSELNSTMAEIPDQFDNLIDSTSLITKMLLLGKHENLNFNPIQLISNLYMPSASRYGLAQSFELPNSTVNLSDQINYFKKLNKSTIPIVKYATSSITENLYTRQLYPQYFMKMYDERFYQDFLENDYQFDATKTVINQQNKELLGYNSDLGSASTYLDALGIKYNNDGAAASRGYSLRDDVSVPSGVTKLKDPDLKFYSVDNSVDGSNTIKFAEAETQVEAISAHIGIYSRSSELISTIASINNSKSGATSAAYILNNLFRLVGGLSSSSTSTMTNPLGVFNRLLQISSMKNLAMTYKNNEQVKKIFDQTIVNGSTTIAQALDEVINPNANKSSYLDETSFNGFSFLSKVSLDVTNNVVVNLTNAKSNTYDFAKYTARETSLVLNSVNNALSTLDESVKTEFTKMIDQLVVINVNDIVDKIIGSISYLVDVDIVDQFKAFFGAFVELFKTNPNAFSPLTVTIDLAKVYGLILNNFANVEAIQDLYQNTQSFDELTQDQLESLLAILGWKNETVQKDSVLEHIIAVFNDPSMMGYQDYQFLFFDKDNSPFYTLINDGMQKVHELVLQYALKNDYWNLSNPVYANEGVERLTYSLEYNGVGDGSVNHFETESNVDQITQTLGGTAFQGSNDLVNVDSDSSYFDQWYNVNRKYNGDLAEQLAYSGTGDLTKRVGVNHKYDITWENVGNDVKPYWVISDIKSYVHSDEVANGVGSTTTGDWTQIYFK